MVSLCSLCKLKLIAVAGMEAPGNPELTIRSVGQSIISPEGRVAIGLGLSDFSSGIWITDQNGDNLEYVVGRNDMMPQPDGSFAKIGSAQVFRTNLGTAFLPDGRFVAELRPSPGKTAFVLLDPSAERIGISGTVYDDFDYDGEVSLDDHGIPNVTVELFTDDGTGNPVEEEAIQSVVTSNGGSFVFESIAAGSYVIKVVSPDGFSTVWDGTAPLDDGLIVVGYEAESINTDNHFLLQEELSYDLSFTLHRLDTQKSEVIENLGNTSVDPDEQLGIKRNSELLADLPVVGKGLVADGISPLLVKLEGPQEPLPADRKLTLVFSSVTGGTVASGLDDLVRVWGETAWADASEEFILPRNDPETPENEGIAWVRVLPIKSENLRFDFDHRELEITYDIWDSELNVSVGSFSFYVRKPPLALIHSQISDGSWGPEFLEILEAYRPGFII